MKRFRFTLLQTIVVMLVLGVPAALLLPSLIFPIGVGGVNRGHANLSHLVKAMYGYAMTKPPIEGGGSPGPGFTGGAFWTTLYSTGVIDDPKALLCPVLGTPHADGSATDYRGPRTSSNRSEVMGCDKPGNHGNDDPKVAMNWVGRSGDVHKVPADVARWADILRETPD